MWPRSQPVSMIIPEGSFHSYRGVWARKPASPTKGFVSLKDPLVTFLFALFFIFFVWYIVGTRQNRQRSFRFFGALRGIFAEELGAKASFESRAEVIVVDPVEPYAKANIQLMMEEREILFLWLFSHFVKGHRDRFVLRAEFVKEPSHELLVADPGSELGRLSLGNARKKGLTVERTTGASGRVLGFAASSGAYKKLAGHLARTILQKDWPVTVVSYHTHKPHLVAVCGISREDILPEFFRRVRKLGFEVLK